ncbi:hypothetical protein ACWDBO_53785 [Streptomyces mirabilis]
MGPERLAAKLPAYERLHRYVPTIRGRRRPSIGQKPEPEDWRRHYPLFPRLLFVPDGTGPADIENRVTAPCSAARQLAPSRFLQDVPIVAAPLADLLHHSPSAPVRRPVHDPDQRVP